METRQFVTNVGLITSNGPYGHNVMACEWTHQISYTPFLILVCIGPGKATFTNIKTSREFGVNIAAADQNSVASIVGNHSGKTIDKIKVLAELGVTFYRASNINTLMIKEAAMRAECKLVRFVEVGDHPLFIGQVLTISDTQKRPLIYHDGKYWRLGNQIKKPDEAVLAQFTDVISKFKRGHK